MIHTVIVPGVGGSEAAHWQTWLQKQLMSCSRVEQHDWHTPVLATWIQQFVTTVSQLDTDLQIVAHSFGCLTTMAALAQYPELTNKIKRVILVAPANPARFGPQGFSKQQHNYADYFQQLKMNVPTTLLVSENDPWLKLNDAYALAHAWQLSPINLGAVGHINVASGFGPFPEIFDYLIPESSVSHINISNEGKYFFKFAI